MACVRVCVRVERSNIKKKKKFFVYFCNRSEDPEAEDVGHKWTLSALLRHLKSEGKDISLLMQKIEDVIIKAILSVTPTIVAAARFVPHPRNCFGECAFRLYLSSTF